MSGAKMAMLEVQMESVKADANRRASQYANTLEQIKIALEEDDPDEALRIVIEALS